jgi:hypothetical protein
MSEVLELLYSELDERKIREIAAHIGADESQTEAAIAAALPTLVSAFGRTSETDQGSQMIAGQMQGIGGGSLGDLLGSILGSSPKRTSPELKRESKEFEEILPPGYEPQTRPSGPSLPQSRSTTSTSTHPRPSPLDRSLGPGNELPPSLYPTSPGTESLPDLSPDSTDDILGKVLGGKKKRVEDAIGKSSGMDLRKIGPLLVILAPLVLGAMKARAGSRSTGNSKSIDPSDLSDMMRGERKSIEQKQGGSLIGKMLDQDGDGDFDLSDIMKLGMKFFFGKR